VRSAVVYQGELQVAYGPLVIINVQHYPVRCR